MSLLYRYLESIPFRESFRIDTCNKIIWDAGNWFSAALIGSFTQTPGRKGQCMENDLNYRAFCSQLDTYFRRNENRFRKSVREGKEEVRYRFFPKGFTAVRKGDAEFVRDTNVKYYHLGTDRLQGDFAVLKSSGGEDLQAYCRFSVEEMFREYQEYGWSGVRGFVESNLADTLMDKCCNR